MIFALHVGATYILIRLLISSFKEYKITINIHTLPAILLGALFLVAAEYACIKHFKACLPSGIFFGIIIFLLQSSSIPAKPVPLFSRIMSLLAMTIFWPELSALLIFHFTCSPTNEQSKS